MSNLVKGVIVGLTAFFISIGASLALEDSVKQACEADVNAFCSAVADDDDALKNCLEENSAALTLQCQTALDEAEG
jgi:hypothetical protein